MKIALCGNPNVGKTTIFNRITNSNAPVGNWHGVTVDTLSKRMAGEKDVLVCDLPGAYSLTARTAEEAITRDNILYGDYDVYVCVAEVNDLRRNLYFLIQLIEAGKRAVLVVNMLDEAAGKVDLGLLSRRLGIMVVGTSEKMICPKADILQAAEAAVSEPPPCIPYAEDMRVSAAADRLRGAASKASLSPLYAALKVMEGDRDVIARLGEKCGVCESCAERDLPAKLRYGYIDSVLKGVCEAAGRYERTNKADKVLLGKFSLPIFFAIMAAVFLITFEAGRPLSTLLGRLIELAKIPILRSDMPEWVRSLLADGIISGVGGVLGFLPQVVILFLLTALLQDSGYMSRVAFVTDGFFKRFGLSGRAAFSMLLGLGCSVTAILSTRGMADKSARQKTAFALPFCPCSARLAVFTAMSAYFELSGLVVAALYILGFFAALAVLFVLNKIGKKKSEEPLLLEIPPYRMPRLKRVMKSVLFNIWSFVARVGSVVLAVSIIMWVLCNFSIGYGFTGGVETSIMSTVSGFIAPVFAPLGFGNWKAVAALISGVAAKETVLSVITALGGTEALFSSSTAVMSFLIFTCLYVPCAATLAALARENGVKSALLSAATHLVVAYTGALIFSGMARLYGYDVRLFFTVIACMAVALCGGITVLHIRKAHKERSATFADIS